MLKQEIPSGWVNLEDETPSEREHVVFKAFNVEYQKGKFYTTDPYCGWINEIGEFVRWPHNFPPTHFYRLP